MRVTVEFGIRIDEVALYHGHPEKVLLIIESRGAVSFANGRSLSMNEG